MELTKPISIVLVVVLMVLMLYFLVMPVYQESFKLGQEILVKQSQYDRASTYYMKVYALLAGIRERQENLGKVDDALPSEFSLAPIVYLLQKKADDANITITNIALAQPATSLRPEAEEEIQTVQPVSFALNLVGTYQNLKNFIVALEKSARLFEINNIAFSSSSLVDPTEPPNQTSQYNFTLQMVTHTY